MKNWLVFAATLSLAGGVSQAIAAGDAAAGKAKSATCAGCHGADGNSANPEWPKLAGQHAKYLDKQLQDFKAGKERNNAMMAPMVATLSEQDMGDLAAYYSAQSIQMGAADEALVELGEKIYRGGNPSSGVAACIGCHGPIGDGMGPGQPWIYPPPLNFTILKGREISGGIIYYQLMNGITGTAMPYFKKELESEKLWEVGDYIAVYFINQSDANTEPRGIDAAWEP